MFLHLNFDVIFTDHVNQKSSFIFLSNTSSKFTFIYQVVCMVVLYSLYKINKSPVNTGTSTRDVGTLQM